MDWQAAWRAVSTADEVEGKVSMKTWIGWLAVGMAALSALAADRANDGRGLIEAFTSNNNYSGDIWPFRWYASAVSGGNSGGASTHAIDRTGANTWAPQPVYQLERYGGNQTVTFTGLVPNASYVAELHLTENYFGGSSGGGAGSRVCNVFVNNVQVDTSLDIYSVAGGPWRALCRQYAATADGDGKIVIKFTNVKDNAHWSGAAVFGSALPTKPGSFSTSIASGSADVQMTWNASVDVHRYYIQRGESAEGPWTDIATVFPENASYTYAGMYDETQPYHYRVVASNGLGIAASDVSSYTPSTTGGVSLMTRGSTIANAPAETYRINALGAAGDPANALAADAVAAHALYLDYAGDSELALASGQTFTLDVLGVGDTGGNLFISGAGTLAAGATPFNVSVANSASTAKVDVAVSGASGVLAKNGGGRLELNGGFSGFSSFILNGGTLSVSNAAAATAPVLSGAATFEKAGEGALVVAQPNPNHSGDVVVRDGALRFNVATPFAGADGRIVVKERGALDVSGGGLAADTVRVANRPVVVEGSGPDGKGAIVNTSASSQYNALAHGSLSGDVTFGGGGAKLSDAAGRWDFRTGSLAMNGHNIEKVGSNMVCLTGIALNEGGTVRIDVKEGYWSSETTTGYSGGAGNVMDVYGGAFFDLYSLSAPFTWTLNLRDGATYRIRNSTAAAKNVLNGPVCLAGGTAVVAVGASKQTTMNGVVSGEGKLFLNSGSGGRLSLMNGANTYSGGTVVCGGDLYADSHGSLPGYDSADTLSVSNGTLIVNYADGKWSSADVQAFSDKGMLFSETSFLGLSVTNEATLDRALTFPLGSMSMYDGGTLRVTQPITLNQGALEVRDGTTLVFDGAFTSSISSRYSGSTSTSLVLTNGAALLVGSAANSSTLAGTQANPARMFVEAGSTFAASPECATNVATKALSLGHSDGGFGILTVNGGTVRHKIMLGEGNKNGGGAIIQNGGVVENQGGAVNDIRYGNVGYGYVELNGGTHTWWGYGTIGGPNENARGAMYLHGGTFNYVPKTAVRLALSRGGCGLLYMDGGTIDFTASSGMLALGELDNPTIGPNSFSTMTIDGEGALANFGNKVTWLGNRTNHTAVINLNNGGVLRTGIFATSDNFAGDRASITALLNFDGGVYKAPATLTMFRADAAKQPDAVTVYPGGAVFDTDAYSLTVNVPLERPEGSGVASVSMPDALLAQTQLIGPPLVRISGGGGRGATAICLYDSTARRVTGVKVTSPGTGYTSAPTVTFEGGICATNRYTGTATLAANSASGGVTKRGSGILYLAATNTFGGPVTVEEGRLCALCTNAIPSGADLLLTGGALASSVPLDLGAVSATSGTVSDVTLSCSSFTKTGDGVLTLQDVTLNPSSPVTVSGGHLRVINGGPGLLEGVLDGYANWNGTPMENNIVNSTLQANTRDGWKVQTTVVYSGYIWNRTDADVTWTLVEDFDDAINVYIDGVQVLYNAMWNAVTKANVTLSPGAHKFEVRLGENTGGAGPTTDASMRQWTAKNTMPIGFAIDFEGRNTFDGTLYTIPVDPGDGSLFTTTLDNTGGAPLGDAGVTIVAGASVDFHSSTAISLPNLAGAGSVSNAAVVASGTWTFDAGDFTVGRHMTFLDSSVDLSGVTAYAFTNASGLDPHGRPVVIAEADRGFTGTANLSSATLTGLPGGGKWSLFVKGNALMLSPVVGTVMILR